MKLEAWARSEIGRVRKSNQDAFGVYPELGLFILADGMGGHAAGDVASRMAVEAIYHDLHHGDPTNADPPTLSTRMARLFGKGLAPSGSEAALRAALQHANQLIVEAGTKVHGDANQRPMGSTAVVLIIVPNNAHARWAHVGDSRLYRQRGGQLALLTADHTLPGDQYRDATTIPTDLPHTNVLLQALGTEPDVDVAAGGATIDPGDVFLLCSDGISGMVSASFIENRLRTAPTLEAAGEAILRGALDAGGRDNATLILVRAIGE